MSTNTFLQSAQYLDTHILNDRNYISQELNNILKINIEQFPEEEQQNYIRIFNSIAILMMTNQKRICLQNKTIKKYTLQINFSYYKYNLSNCFSLKDLSKINKELEFDFQRVKYNNIKKNFIIFWIIMIILLVILISVSNSIQSTQNTYNKLNNYTENTAFKNNNQDEIQNSNFKNTPFKDSFPIPNYNPNLRGIELAIANSRQAYLRETWLKLQKFKENEQGSIQFNYEDVDLTKNPLKCLLEYTGYNQSTIKEALDNSINTELKNYEFDFVNKMTWIQEEYEKNTHAG